MNISELKKLYHEKGYFLVEKLFNQDCVDKINKEIEIAKDTIQYHDRKGQIRRIERIYDKGKTLSFVNQELLKLLEKIFDFKFTIFKDKFNAKPPGGEGFFCHYDGIFHFKDKNDNLKKGWYHYGSTFTNILVALDPCNNENGTIELSDSHNDSFENLLENTNKDGTPNLKIDIEKKLDFEVIDLKAGDILIFKNTCPHRSKKNNSRNHRKTLYYTYTPLKYGSMYIKYFLDKESSKNKRSKSLSGEI